MRKAVILVRTRLARCTCLVFALLCGSAGTSGAPLPARLVSTSPGITEVLFALGLGDRVVGVSTYCRYPEAVVSIPKVGTYLRPDAESIARLRPDLAFVRTGPNDVPRQLTQLGIRAVTIDDADTVARVYAMIRVVGGAAGASAQAESLVADIRSRLDRLKARRAGRVPPRVLVVVGRSPGSLTDLIAVGRGSYLSEVVDIAGGVNVLADALPGYPRISMETVIRLAPDVIVDAGDMGDSVAEHVRRQPLTERLWKEQTAVRAAQRGAVHAVTSDAFVVPGPRIVEAAETLSSWLNASDAR